MVPCRYMQRWSDSGEQWQDLYFFMEVEFFFRDYQMANGWMERPDSFFSQARSADSSTLHGTTSYCDAGAAQRALPRS